MQPKENVHMYRRVPSKKTYKRYQPMNLLLLEIQFVFQHQHLHFFGLKLNKYNTISGEWEIVHNSIKKIILFDKFDNSKLFNTWK